MIEPKGYTGILWFAARRSSKHKAKNQPIPHVHTDLYYPFENEDSFNIQNLQPDCHPLELHFASDKVQNLLPDSHPLEHVVVSEQIRQARFQALKHYHLVGSINLWAPYKNKVTTSQLLAICDRRTSDRQLQFAFTYGDSKNIANYQGAGSYYYYDSRNIFYSVKEMKLGTGALFNTLNLHAGMAYHKKGWFPKHRHNLECRFLLFKLPNPEATQSKRQ